MIFYRLACLRGTSAQYETFETWAKNIVEAFDKAKAVGLWPCAMTYCGSQQTIHVGGGIYIPIGARPTPITTEGGGES
jgi:hypothetical protein